MSETTYKNSGDSGDSLGPIVCVARARKRVSGKGGQPGPNPAPPEVGDWYQVTACDPVLGVGKNLERIRATSRAAAETTARARHGKHILVTLAGGKPRRRRELARDLGNIKRRR